MSKIILVSATPLEHGGLKELNGIPIFHIGIGKISAASNLTEILWNEEPDVVINFGSCGNLKDHKIGEVLEVGEVINDMDTAGLSEIPVIKLSEEGVKCFTTDTIYDGSHERYTDSYNKSVKECGIVDMECYALAHVCKERDIPFHSYKWVSDDGTPSHWVENCKVGFDNFKSILSNITSTANITVTERHIEPEKIELDNNGNIIKQ
jgi:adenosylhomocysteine nucleosidase